MYKAIDLFCFNDDKIDYSNEFFALYAGNNAKLKARLAASDSSRILNTRPTLALKEYTGIYENELYGTVTVAMENDSLLIKRPGGRQATLSHWHYDTFKGKVINAWTAPLPVQFSLNPAAKVDQVTFAGVMYKKRQ